MREAELKRKFEELKAQMNLFEQASYDLIESMPGPMKLLGGGEIARIQKALELEGDKIRKKIEELGMVVYNLY